MLNQTIDKRLTNRIVLDTETTKKGYVMDMAWLVYNKNGIITEKRFLISDAFNIDTPFNDNQTPYYNDLLNSKELPLVSIEQATIELLKDMETYQAKVFAYNCTFDYNHINQTLEQVKSNIRLVQPFIDIWSLSYNTILQTKSYIRTAKEHNWYTEKGNLKTSAECVYRYISQDKDFIEDHTALSDVRIEKEILEHALRQHKKRNYETPNWRVYKNYIKSIGL